MVHPLIIKYLLCVLLLRSCCRVIQNYNISFLSVCVCVRAATKLTRNQLNSLNSSISQLQSSLDVLQDNITAVTNRINKTLSNTECRGCEELRPELQNLMLDTTISVRPDSNCTCHVNQINL